ncbi:MAG: hypothetical protein KIT87_17105 [Anaerolineae bacterium]|nr:hypothetical protein [Anaerolineae bacterium]
MTHPAAALYHDTLARTDAPELAETLFEQMRARGLTFGDRVVCSVLRPHFISERDYHFVQDAAVTILGAIARLGEAVIEDEGLRAKIGLTPEEEAIIALPFGYSYPDASARLDSFFVGQDSLYFIEYNAESPGGLAFGEGLGELFSQFPVMQAVARTYPYRLLPIRKRILDTLLECFYQWGGRRQPNIAIIDWREVRTYNEFLMCQEAFEAAGYPTRIGDPRDLEYTNGRLRLGDFEIDLVYKRVVTGELLQREGLNSPLVRAAADGAVCLVNSFRSHLLLKKALFALLSDPQYRSLYTPAQQAALAEHIPWTRLVAPGFTDYDGQRVDLLEFAAQRRDQLVLKPSGEYGGKGVVLGWEVGAAGWETALHEALTGSYVVQERVPVPRENFPVLLDGEIVHAARYLDLDPYAWQGTQAYGCGVRLSGGALLNVSAGGGSAVPMFILKD